MLTLHAYKKVHGFVVNSFSYIHQTLHVLKVQLTTSKHENMLAVYSHIPSKLISSYWNSSGMLKSRPIISLAGVNPVLDDFEPRS